MLYVGVSLKWHSFQSEKGIFNFSISVFVATIVTLVPFFIMKQVNRMKIFQEEGTFDNQLRLASDNARRSIAYRSALKKNTFLSRGREDLDNSNDDDSNEELSVENFSPLIDANNLPQRRQSKFYIQILLI